ncbi:MAG: DUF4157 domain-containing protein [Eubacterium sp.]|nr:DUF4157 domain-containing protein [Eubacterium sp.]
MDKAKQAFLQKRTKQAKRNSGGGNRTGISEAVKVRHEAVSGLPFDDVRVHYHSRNPEPMQALANTRGDHVYIAPGQERHLRHELGHMVQQKHGRASLEEFREKRGNDLDTARIYWVGDFFKLMKDIRDARLINEVSREMNGRLASMQENESIGVLQDLHSLGEEERKRIVSALNPECCNWLWHAACWVQEQAKQDPAQFTGNDVSCASDVQALVECRFAVSEADWAGDLKSGCLDDGVTDAQRYEEVEWQIEYLNAMIDQLKAMIKQAGEKGDLTKEEKEKREQLKELIKYGIVGCLRLQMRFKGDFKMRQLPLEALKEHFREAFGEESDGCFDEMPASVPNPAMQDGLSPMYATEKSRQVPLPKRSDLSAAIDNNEPVFRDNRQSFSYFAKAILEKVKSMDAEETERLVIFRGMNGTEALSILKFFNSPDAADAEAALRHHDQKHPFDIHDKKHIARLGKHYGEYAQAERYRKIAPNEYANVLLAFILKPGAKRLLFSKSMLALYGKDLRWEHASFAEASANEGTAPGYIGVKSEQRGSSPGVSSTYSLGVAQGEGDAGTKSQLLLQLLIDRVEVRRILF